MAAYKTWHEFLPHIPKDARYSLGVKVDILFTEAIGLIFNAIYVSKYDKSPHIQRATLKLDLTKFFLQILWELKALDNKKYTALSEKIDGLGKMMGGWMRQLNKTNPARGGE